jgi:uncharacterized protein (DUF2141 family)
MKAKILITLAIFASALAKAQEVKMNINITNIEPGKGTVVLNVYDKKEDFLKKVFLSKTLKANSSTLTIALYLPKKGVYAVTVFQDLDDNKKLKQDWFGIPQEPVGYGNNFKPSAKPRFNDCAITLGNDPVTQVIKLF